MHIKFLWFWIYAGFQIICPPYNPLRKIKPPLHYYRYYDSKRKLGFSPMMELAHINSLTFAHTHKYIHKHPSWISFHRIQMFCHLVETNIQFLIQRELLKMCIVTQRLTAHLTDYIQVQHKHAIRSRLKLKVLCQFVHLNFWRTHGNRRTGSIYTWHRQFGLNTSLMSRKCVKITL